MNVDFLAGILVARMLEGMQFAVGPTIVARRRALESIGGFERMKDYLAEDFVLGKFASEAGHGVILSSYVVEHHIGSSEFSAQRRTPAAMGPQHPAVASAGLPRPSAHDAAAVGHGGVRGESGVVAGAAADAGDPLRGRLRGFDAGATGWLNWALVPLEDLAGFCILDRRIFSETPSSGAGGVTGCIPTAGSNCSRKSETAPVVAAR